MNEAFVGGMSRVEMAGWFKKNMSDSHINTLPSRRIQRGYLLEIPLLLAVVGIGVSILLPYLSPLGRKILLGMAVTPILFCLYYMIVIPGWTPNSDGRLKQPWNILVFLLLAVAFLAGVSMYILGLW